MDIKNNIKSILDINKPKEYYINCYNELINDCRSRVVNNDLTNYLELHHIIPKCLGGSNDKENLVYMTSLEYIVAHCLLFLMYNSEEKIIFAAWSMLLLNKSTNDRKDAIDFIISNAADIRRSIYEARCRAVVYYDENNNLIRIFPSTSSVTSIGIKGKNITSTINGKRKTVAGYFWKYLEDFEKDYPDKVKEYKENEKNGILPKIHDIDEINSEFKNKYSPSPVVCYNNNFDVIKIFQTMGEAYREINSYYNSNTATTRGKVNGLISLSIRNKTICCRYYWEYLDIFKEKYPDKIENYYKTICNNNHIVLSKRIQFLVFSLANEFIRIVDSDYIRNSFGKSITNLLITSTDRYSYFKGYIIYKVEDYQNLTKLNEYFKLNNMIGNINLEFSDIIVKCDSKNNIIKRYNTLIENHAPTYNKLYLLFSERKFYYDGFYWYPINYYNKYIA